MPNIESLQYIIPELILGCTAVVVFLLAAAAAKKPAWQSWLFPIITSAALLIGIKHIFTCETVGQGGLSLFHGLLVSDPFSAFFRVLVMLAVLVCVIISMGSTSLPKDKKGEYHGMLLVMAMGMCFLSGSNHLLMIYVSIEAVSLCSYILTGWDTRRQRSREASLKYVLYGGAASGVMLFGMSLLYGITGTLSLQEMNAALSASSLVSSDLGPFSVMVSLALILAGMGYKVAAAPFHMWSPDVYEGAPTPFTALLSVGPKAVGFALVLRFFYGLFLAPGSMESLTAVSDTIPWALFIGIMSAVTMTIGNFAAIAQNNVKRLLAYSSVAHAGYILMGVVAGGTQGFESVAVYLAIYLVMNMGAFAMVAAVNRYKGSEDIDAFRNIGITKPVWGVLMALFLVSLTGLPPSAGFIGKLYLFTALVKHGGYWYMVLAVIGLFNSVVSLYYYARILKAMYFEKPENEHLSKEDAFTAPVVGVALVLATVTLVLGLYWQPLATAAKWSASMFH